ncbi:MAG: hypothetical protein LBK53_05270 [Heliobacteriaceae bacterium]|jgi:hypothetical protein|nr:hypothetical protein [Heliobacteriaceae bacterium]
MVDNRSAGFYGIGGGFNFKSGNISGTTAKLSDDKMGQGGEYANLRKDGQPEETHAYPFMDRSAVLRATLNSLAMMNVADVINARKRAISPDDDSKGQHQENQEQKEDGDNKEEETQSIEAIEEHLIGDEDFDEDSDEDFDFAGGLED